MLTASPKGKPQRQSWALALGRRELSCAYIPRAGGTALLNSAHIPGKGDGMGAAGKPARWSTAPASCVERQAPSHRGKFYRPGNEFATIFLFCRFLFPCICIDVFHLVWFQNEHFMHAASNPGVPARHSSQPRKDRPGQGPLAAQAPLGLML